jgi:protein TonB
METNKILDADILDLVFDGRNKEYGAYDLRKHYNGRLGRAIAVTGGVVVVLFCFGFVSGRGKVKDAPMVTDVVIASAPPTPLPPTPPPPVVPRTQPQVATKIFTAPKLVEHDVPEDEKPPANDDLDKVKIGTVNTPGDADMGINAGPTALGDGHTGLVTAPKQDEDDKVLRVVEIDASYPGGMPAWGRFLNKNLKYPEDAVEKGIQGPVMVEFIVDKEGNVSDIQVISGPTDGGLREEAIRVIKRSGKWTPAIQNGRNVKAYKRQPVIFQMADQ